MRHVYLCLWAIVLVSVLQCDVAGQSSAGGDVQAASATPPVALEDLILEASRESGITIVYERAHIQQDVMVATPRQDEPGSAMALLRSVLPAVRLVLAETGRADVRRIVWEQQLPEYTKLARDGETYRPDEVITRVFRVNHADASQIMGLLATHVSKPGGMVGALPSQNMVIVTDRAASVAFMAELLEALDVPPREAPASQQ